MKPLDDLQKSVLKHSRFAVEGPPGSGKSNTLEGYDTWQRSQGQEVLVLVRKRKEAEVLRDRGLRAFTLQSHRYRAMDFPDILTPKDLGYLLEGLQKGEKSFDALAVDEIHNWSPEFFDIARSLWTEKDFVCFFDDHQSLMYWAGAVRDLREELRWSFGITNIVHLVNNYRSAPKVVEVLKAIVPREMVSKAKVGQGYFHIEKCYNFDDECRFIYNQLLSGYEDVQILARNSSICKRVSSYLRAKGVPHELYLTGDKESEITKGLVIQTVHTAQATEHMTVFLISAVQGILPDFRSLEGDEHNIFYVGCSRAMRDLFISYYSAPSQFITKGVRALSE